MSLRSEGDDGDGQSPLSLLEDWYHVPALVAVVAVMLWIRLQSYDNYIRNGEVFFSGNDAWYHLREVQYTVRHWPATMPFDPWTYFPYGTSVGQFGTLYDQLVATTALVVGLGSPSDALVAKTLLVAPAVFGALTAIPVYYLGKRLGGRLAGVFSAVLLMLMPGTFLSRTLVGHADHNGVEPLFQAIAVLGLLVAFVVAEREMPIWELVVDRDVEALKTPVLWAGLGGVALALYMWVWPPGVLLVGIVGLFLVVKLTSDTLNGTSPEPVAFAGAVSLSVAGLLMLVPLQSLALSPTEFSLVQPLLSFAVAGGAVFMAWLAREFDARDLDDSLYPVAVFGLLGTGAVVTYVALPDLFSLVRTNLLRTVGFSAGAQTRTIAEAQPFLDPGLLAQQGLSPTGAIMSEYGIAFFTAIGAIVWLFARPLVRTGETREVGYAIGGLAVVGLLFIASSVLSAVAGAFGLAPELFGVAVVAAILVGATLQAEYDAETLFVGVWTLFIVSAAFTQVRFNYYLAIPIAVVNAFLLGEVLRYLDLRKTLSEAVEGIEGYQVLVIVAVVALMLGPVFMVPVAVGNTGNAAQDESLTAWERGNRTSPGAVTVWDDSLAWMEDETPAVGNLGGAGNQDQLDYYGTYHEGDGDFKYPDGSYGVQSWWDYGHWITVKGERVPNANPFQQGATEAANFLLAPNETQAQGVLAEQSTEGEHTRYVMVDWQMVTPGSKFGAPIVFYDAQENVSSQDFYFRMWQQTQQGGASPAFLVRDQRYYDSLMVRLYEYHGSAMDPQPIVLDWDEQTFTNQRTGESVTLPLVPSGNQSLVRTGFDNVSQARAYVEQDGSAQIGGIGPYPEERVPALEHYRLVKVSQTSAYQSRDFQSSLIRASRATGVPPQYLSQTPPTWLKTFERVPGATIDGSGAPPNATVTASVQMRMPTTDQTFTYRQRARANADGEFTMTLPYSTTGYADYGPENGYTNVSVRAAGPYRISTPTVFNESGYLVAYQQNVSVEEGRVNGDVTSSKSVELERKARQPQITSNSNVTVENGSSESLAGGVTPVETIDSSGSLSAPTTAGDSSPDVPALRERLAVRIAG